MFIKESCIVEIYTKSTESFSVGRVFCQDEDCVIFENIDVQGKITGYYVMKKSSISQLHYHTEYLGKIRKYMEYGKEHSYSNWFSLKPVALNRGGSLILQVLEYAKDNHIVITLETDQADEPEAGYLKEMVRDKIIFSCLDVSTAQLSEEITIPVQDIVFIEFESIDNLLLQYANTALTIH